MFRNEWGRASTDPRLLSTPICFTNASCAICIGLTHTISFFNIQKRSAMLVDLSSGVVLRWASILVGGRSCLVELQWLCDLADFALLLLYSLQPKLRQHLDAVSADRRIDQWAARIILNQGFHVVENASCTPTDARKSISQN